MRLVYNRGGPDESEQSHLRNVEGMACMEEAWREVGEIRLPE